ncbi:uncharacterized protein LOC119741148 [Patiria miniata]|uniref:Uncharacterized protein n=1 Tax=Patiria miniata TaxID=46514 RepID=A0A914B9B9_PATMI|nr:uncharacterized protein LOC119741148 [Patiria miniata]
MLRLWSVGCAIYICILVTNLKRVASTGDLRIFSDRHCDCLHAEYSWRNNTTVLLESYTGDDEGGSGRIVSRVSLMKTGHWKRSRQDPVTLSVLEIPSKDIHDLVIDGISELVTSSAQYMSRTVGKSGIPSLADLVPMYDAMFEKLHRSTRGWPFTQARWATFYHFSVIHAAERIRGGVPAQDACPPYRGYATGKTGGLFVCRQEYEGFFLSKQVVDEKQLMMKIYGQAEQSNFEDVVEALARLNACGSFDCDVPGCASYRYDFGWHILGSDSGCCGDYPRCCDFAAPFCFFHDILCECCSYFVCPEPYCKPAPSCTNTTVV